jgi:preprotein translocase subunit SecF
MDITGKRYLYFAISLLIIIPGIISLGVWGLHPSIDFTGGSYLELKFDSPKEPLMPGEIQGMMAKMGFESALVQTSTDGTTLFIRTTEMSNEEKNALEAKLGERYGKFVEEQFTSIGPSVGKEVTQRATYAVVAAAVAILLYITYAFRSVSNPFRYGTCAIIAMVHDILVTVGVFSILAHFFGWQMDALFLTALLTVIGFSVHDTIVVFDRIRENMRYMRGIPFEKVVNHSILQTLDRSINTQLTVLFTLTALSVFGGISTRHFVLTMLIGILSGTYSSIFNASPLLVVWENDEIGRFFRRLLGKGEEPAAA